MSNSDDSRTGVNDITQVSPSHQGEEKRWGLGGMLRIIVTVLFLTNLLSQVIAQEMFLTFLNNQAIGFYAIESDVGYHASGFSSFGQGTFYRSNETDFIGNNQSTWIFEIDTMDSIEPRQRSYFQSENGNHYCAGAMLSENGTIYGSLITFGSQLNSVETDPITFSLGFETLFSFGTSLSGDSLLIMGTIYTPPGNVEVLILCMDTLGNIHWQNNIASPGQDIFPVDAYPTSDGGYLITCNDYEQDGGDVRVHSRVFKCDALGNVLWEVMPGNHEEHYTQAGGTALLDDDSFITFWTEERIIGNQGADQTNPLQSIYYALYDSDGSLINEGDYWDYLEPAVSSGLPNYRYFIYHVNKQEDHIIISGSNLREGKLLKTNFDGNPIWHRSYSTLDDPESNDGFPRTRLYGVYPSSDGGYMATGEFSSFESDNYPQGIQTSILLKVDSVGCLDVEDCEPIPDGLWEWPGSFPNDSGLGVLRVYPNPTSGIVRVEMPGSSATARSPNNGLRLDILDQRGMLVEEMSNVELQMSNDEVEIDLSNHSAGLYYLRLIADEGIWTGKVSLR